MHCALRFRFKASNNKVEYEELIVGLNLAKEMKVESLEVYSDSQLIVCQLQKSTKLRVRKWHTQSIKSQGHKMPKQMPWLDWSLQRMSNSWRSSLSNSLVDQVFTL